MRLYPEDDWRRLVRYLTGECSAGQKEQTEAWILENEERAQLMDELNQIWDATDLRLQDRDVDAAWEEIRAELTPESYPERNRRDQKAGTSAETSDRPPEGRRHESYVQKRRSGRVRPSVVKRLSGIGGVLLIATILVSLLVWDVSFDGANHSGSKTFSTEAGQRATVRLNDGSNVHLNVDSRLTLSSGFAENNRTVRLEGEAYFEVADEKSTPFVVQVDGIRAEVVGTAFNIESYSGASGHQVAVTEGSVTVHSDQSADDDTLQLRANNLGIVSGGHIQVVRGSAEIQKEIAWKDGQLVFDDAPFDRVVRELERWYDIPVKAEVDAKEVDHLNATFQEESLREAARAISVALDLQYEDENGTVTFYRRNEAETL